MLKKHLQSHIMNRLFATVLILLGSLGTLCGRSTCQVERYDDHNGLSQWYVTGMVKDNQGMLWFSTWNGLNRYDGYQFEVFKSFPGDSCDMGSDRQTSICLSPSGDSIFVLIGDSATYSFDLHTYRYSSLNDYAKFQSRRPYNGVKLLDYDHTHHYFQRTDRFGTLWRIQKNGTILCQQRNDDTWRTLHTDYTEQKEISKVFADNQDNLWAIDRFGVDKISLYHNPFEYFPREIPAQARAFLLDKKNRYWVSSKEDQTVRIFGADNHLIGYLTPSGKVVPHFTSFGASVYCFKETADGTLWLGSMLMLLCTACGGSGSESDDNNPPKVQHHLQINIYTPEHPVVTRSDEPVLVNSNADENVNSLDVWVFVSQPTAHFTVGQFVGHLSLDIADPKTFKGGTYQMSVNEDFVNEHPNVNVYVTANVKPENTGITLSANSSESALKNATFGDKLDGDYFGLTQLTTQVPSKGLPMSGVLKDQSINYDNTPLLKINDRVTVVRAVSKIRFIFSRSDTGDTDQLHINSIKLYAGMIPAEEYLFLKGPYDYTDIKKRSHIKEGTTYLPAEETTLADELESIIIPASTYPARFAYDPENPDQLKGQDYEDLIDRGLQGVDNNNNPELVELQRYYLRESDKKLKGKIYYTIGNGGEGWPKYTEFEMVAAGDFTRNHTWIVYGYFTGKETLTISSIDVTNWSLINTEHNVYNW